MLEQRGIGDGAWISYVPAWLDAEEGHRLLAELLGGVPWEQRPIFAFGEPIVQPRLMGWGGELPYRYSGQTLEPRPLPGCLEPLLARVSEAVGVPFNHVVFNRYRDGQDNIAYHADNEPELGRCPVIAAVSLGVRRKLVITPKRKRSVKRTHNLDHGSLFVMGGSMQHTWRHAVPKQASVTGERINVTFRLLHGPPGWRQPRDGE